MQAAHDRQKSYADLKRKPMEFQVGDKVMLKVLPWKGVVRFGKRGKLNPRYVGLSRFDGTPREGPDSRGNARLIRRKYISTPLHQDHTVDKCNIGAVRPRLV
ncbi:hypothetical protein Tco_1210190 [Tanacetum coccineum]